MPVPSSGADSRAILKEETNSNKASQSEATASKGASANTSRVATTMSNSAIPSDPDQGPTGCYLVYDPGSSGCLVLHYSTGYVPPTAVGFWCPGEGKTIQGFKFKQAGGRSELIKGIAGGDQNRRKYFSGWCQFLKMAKQKDGQVIQFAPGGANYKGVPVDIYGFIQSTNCPVQLPVEEGLVDIGPYDAVAVMPRHAAFLKGVKTTNVSNFLELGNLAGASTTLG